MGTYNRHIGLYDSGSDQQIELLENVHQGGLTSLKFMPNNPNQLVSAARKCNMIKVRFIQRLERTHNRLVLGFALNDKADLVRVKSLLISASKSISHQMVKR